MAQNQILCGGQRSGRKEQTQKTLRENYPKALLIVPTRQYAQRRIIELLSDGIYAVDKNIVSDFTQFTYNLLIGQNLPIYVLEEWEQILLIQSIILSDTGKPKFEQYEGLIAPENLAPSFHRIIRNLKQAGITPETFEEKIRMQTIEPWDEVVCWVYSTYQEQLLKHNWYDIPGLLWQAEIECQKGNPVYIEGKKVLILDGFDDFTHSELRLIKALSPYFERMIIGINYDVTPSRQDVYRLAKDTLMRLQSLLDVEIVFLDTPPPNHSIEYISDTLFWRDEPKPFSPTAHSIVAVEQFINREEEIKNIGRKIKQLLVQEKVPPQRIAVTYRQLNSVRPLIEKVFSEYGIPYRIGSPRSIKETWVGQFMERWFTQLNEKFFSAFTFLLHDPLWNIPISLREKFFLLLQHGGLSTYMRVEHIIWKLDNKEKIKEVKEKHISEIDIQQFIDEIQRWLSWREKFQQKSRISDYVTLTLNLLNSVEDSLKISLSTVKDNTVREREKKAYSHFVSILKKLPIFYENQPLSLDEFQRLLFFVLSEIPLFETGHNYGVVCVDLPLIRNMEYDYLFVGGVEEGLIPLSPSLNVIYSDNDITKLRDLGLPIDDVAKQIQREWLFFQQIFESAQKGVFFSHVWYSETHEERSPSLLLRELQELRQYIQENNLINSKQHLTIPCSPSELRNLLFSYQTDEEVLKKQYSDIYNCWFAYQKREAGNENEYTGNLQSDDIRNYFTQRFGNNHIYSVEQIEEYIECPFRFWAHRILALEDWEEELVVPSPLMIGSWAHEILNILLKEYFDKLQIDKLSIINEKLKSIVEGVVYKDRKISVFSKKIVDITTDWLNRILTEFICSEASLIEEDWKPAHFEIAFGKTLYQMEDEKSQSKPYCMQIQDKTVLFSGRIDRIDIHTNNPLLRIIDYKWGKTPTGTDMGVKNKQLQDKMCSFQLIIYELAIEEHLFKKENLSVAESCFLSLTEQKKTSAPWAGDKNLQETIVEKAKSIIFDTLQNIYQGKFTPMPYKKESCDYCFCKNACRYKRIERSEESGDEVRGEVETT